MIYALYEPFACSSFIQNTLKFYSNVMGNVDRDFKPNLYLETWITRSFYDVNDETFWNIERNFLFLAVL